MIKNDIKSELLNIHKAQEEIDKQLINIKVALHTLDKLGIKEFENIEKELYNQLDNVGIEYYKMKQLNEKLKKLL